MLAEGEYEGNGGFVCFDDRTGVVLLFRGENAKSLDILDPFHENIYEMVITELLPSHSCDRTSMERIDFSQFTQFFSLSILRLSDFPIPFSIDSIRG